MLQHIKELLGHNGTDCGQIQKVFVEYNNMVLGRHSPNLTDSRFTFLKYGTGALFAGEEQKIWG
eukprot:scaffold21961_cov67-Cyclotella_meneghiniana.AAC.3